MPEPQMSVDPPTNVDRSARGGALNRRRFVGLASGTLAGTSLTVAAQSDVATPEIGTPVAVPDEAAPVNGDALYALSEQLVGGGSLQRGAADALAKLLGADPALVAGFEELIALDEPTSKDALGGLSRDAQKVVNNILQYWYLGNFDGQPVENRAEIFFGLPVWGTVPYSTQPTLCKAFGYWASDVAVHGG